MAANLRLVRNTGQHANIEQLNLDIVRAKRGRTTFGTSAAAFAAAGSIVGVDSRPTIITVIPVILMAISAGTAGYLHAKIDEKKGLLRDASNGGNPAQ